MSSDLRLSTSALQAWSSALQAWNSVLPAWSKDSAAWNNVSSASKWIQDLRQLFLWGFGLVFAGLFALFGFVVWDRRTALIPALRRLDEMRDRQQRMEETLKRYAEKVPELAEELRATGLLQ